MIERLNFYDLYGYLLPGAVLIAVSFFPFFLTGVPLPSLEWASALGSLMCVYILGHLLQILARTGLNEDPNPSDLLLTSHPRSFPPEVAILACAVVGPLVWAARVISPFSLACTVALVAGAVSAEQLRPSDQLFLLLASAAALLTLSALFFVAHRHFRWSFAEAVYTTYYARRRSPLANGALKT